MTLIVNTMYLLRYFGTPARDRTEDQIGRDLGQVLDDAELKAATRGTRGADAS